MLNMLTGVDYSMTDDFSSAMKYLNRALELTDSVLPAMRGDVLTAIGDAYYKAAEPDSAFACYEQAIAIDPGNLLALNNCAYYLACEGRDLDRAEAMISTVIREKPTDPTSLDTYAWVLFRKQRLRQSQGLYRHRFGQQHRGLGGTASPCRRPYTSWPVFPTKR